MKKILLLVCCMMLLAGAVAVAAQKQTYSPAGSASSSPLSAAVEGGGLVFTSGQIPVDAQGNIPGDFKSQMTQTMNNVRAALELAGTSMDKVVKVTVFLDDFDDFNEMNAIYRTYFTSNFPARSTVEVSKLARGVKVEIEAIAVK